MRDEKGFEQGMRDGRPSLSVDARNCLLAGE
jgi:hypothetical protein